MDNDLAHILDSIPSTDDWALSAAMVQIAGADYSRLSPEAIDALQTIRSCILAEMGERVARAYVEKHGPLPFN